MNESGDKAVIQAYINPLVQSVWIGGFVMIISIRSSTSGFVPLATSSSIIAGLQCQELLKLVHGEPVAGGTGVVMNGQITDLYRVEYQRRPDCLAHETLDEVVDLPDGVATLTVGSLLTRVRAELGDGASIELPREIISHLECPGCGAVGAVFRPLGTVQIDEAPCPECGAPRFPVLVHTVGDDWPHQDMTAADLGLPPLDLVIGRRGDAARGYLFGGDRARVLADLDPADGPGQRHHGGQHGSR